MKILWSICTLALAWCNSHATETNRPASRPVNLLFIMTDQQRWDALSCAGNPAIKTPNLDRLARQGARFTSFYSACPVCVPARTAMLTGHSIESNHVLSNGDEKRTDAPPFPSFDQILLRNGYRGEYHGKFHSPYRLAMDYTQPVRWLNGKQAPPGCQAEISESEAYVQFIERNVPDRPLQPGQLAMRQGNYTPIPLDENFGKTPKGKTSQAGMYGRLEIPAEFSRTAFTAKEGIAALERLRDGPFTLTISIGPPHPPFVVSEPYYSLYPPGAIPVPASINDPRTNSPYPPNKRERDGAYRNPENIRQMTSIYYGMVAEVDHWVGNILQRLDELGLADNTLVIFTSDHGEMLGDHGMNSKNIFYEGSVHVPLLLRLPGVIPAGTVVPTPSSHLDLFATILDYCGQREHASEGESLRPFIEGKESGVGRVAVSEWNSQSVPGFMIFDGRWKYLCGQTADAPSLDALYDLKNDPQELNNLIGRNPDREKARAEAMRMKGLLVDWLARVKSPHLESVRARPLFGQAH
ncbi:MAG: sulfatase-like hydrolase/transferase [Verrucomicrobia bacterium]|nr:sulfatase-like hydrolase/transferase [Verrucomicrobiota bacterium]